ncbi:MAG: VOC family protein [Actinomycetota bacterium]
MSRDSGPIGRLQAMVLDCPDALALAHFYHSIIGGEVVEHPDEDDWVELRTTAGWLAFQETADHVAPTWPNNDVPQQAHVDVAVADLDAGERAVIAVGARKTATQPMPEEFRVFLDPVGHPFCLVPGGD